MANESQSNQTDNDWENRVLCSDGNCIGVIGPDGRCKECGLAYEGDLPAAVTEEPAAAQTDFRDTSGAGTDETAADSPEEAADAMSDDEWANRRLCRDGNCIGIIGPDGNCKECGRPYDV
jgi:hypothetical protein